MTRSDVSRLRRLDLAEISWRARGAADIAVHRMLAAARPPRWRRARLAAGLAMTPELGPLRQALQAERWNDAHLALARYFRERPARFVIAPGMRAGVAASVRQRFPGAAAEAKAHAERLLAGRYDVLGYRDLVFDGRSWHTDGVHGRTAPWRFWSQVPYLSPECGDHKVTWELNRHQHWMALGRAFWLTGDSRYRAECLRQLESWLSANPPLVGINWASMLELAFRSLSWIWTLNFFVDEAAHDADAWTVDLLLALDRQLTQVERHLSYYFSPNTHLIGEALALYVSGRTLPLLGASARRETTGRRVLLSEIGRQIASDGGHCERSAHYHRYTLDFYLLALAVARITDDPAAPSFERACARLGHAARVIADDRGRLPHLGDDDGGSLFPLTGRATDDASDSLALAAVLTDRVDLLVGAPPEEVWWVLGHERFAKAVARVERTPAPMTVPSSSLPTTGYYVSRNEQGDHLTIDAGPHGYLNGGHAHADALSLTLSLGHTPFLIDPGTGCYTVDATTRDRFRSSALHNTLTLDGRSQSLPRGPFHWQHTARAVARCWRTSRRFDYFVGRHDGYAPLIHYRHLLMLHGELLVVADCVTGESPALVPSHAAVHWHVHPRWQVEIGGARARLASGAARVELHVAGGSLDHLVADEPTGLGWWSPAYGRVEPAHTLRVKTRAPAPLWLVSVFALSTHDGVRQVTLEPVDAPRAGLSHAAAIHIRRDHSVDRVVVAEASDELRQAPARVAHADPDARMLFTRETATGVTLLAMVAAEAGGLEPDRKAS